MRIDHFLLGLSLLAASLPVQAQVYRCTGASGEPSFSQAPCGTAPSYASGPAPGAAGRGLRDSEASWLKSRESRRRTTDRPRKVVDGRKAKRQQAYRCQKRQRQLDAVSARLRRGYKPAQGERLRRQRRAHEDYIAAFCS